MMKKNKLNQKDWLVHLNNLINREINKRNSSGITTWALFGLIGFTLSKLLDSLPIIFMDIKSVFLTKLFITNIFNFFIMISLFMPTLLMPQRAKRKIHTELLKKYTIFATGIISFIYITGFFCNIFIIIDLKFYGLSILPYCVFAIFEIIFIIVLLIINIITAKKKSKMPGIDSGYYYITKRKNPVKNTLIFLSLFLLFSFLFSIYQIKQNYYILNHLSVLKSAIYLSVFIGAIILFIGNRVVHMRNIWLEEFERKIMLQNLDEKEIVKAFIDEFVGKEIVQWLKEIEDETKEEKTSIIRLYNKLEKECNSLNQREKDLNRRTIKAENLLKKFNELIKDRLSKHIEKFSINTDKVTHFLKQGPLSDEEELLIREFIRTRKKDNKIILDMQSKIKTRIKEFDKYVNATEKLVK